MNEQQHYFGIDLGAKRVHVVSVDDQLKLAAAFVFDARDHDGLRELLKGASVVAIDAPSTLSTAPHESDTSLSPKFRTARCAEISLGKEHKIWVPWATPTVDQPLAGWMALGFEIFRLAKELCADVVEVYPHACFRVLAGKKLASKQTAAGTTERVALLQEAGLQIQGLEMWSHDSLDAAIGAVTAYRKSVGTATLASCGHDHSAIWLPS